MTSTANVKASTPLSPLQRARALDLPSREAVLHRSPSVQQFWDGNKHLLADGWKEWEESRHDQLFKPDDSLLDAKLRNAVIQAWQDPAQE